MNLPKTTFAIVALLCLGACTDKEINDGIDNLEGKNVVQPVGLFDSPSVRTTSVSEAVAASSGYSIIATDVSSSAVLSSESSVEPIVAPPVIEPVSSSSSKAECYEFRGVEICP